MASRKVPCLFDALMEALEELDPYVFQTFKLYLRDKSLLGEFEVIGKSKLETDDRTEILTAMMDSYGIFTISVMKTVLKELHQNNILKGLSQYPYDPEAIVTAYKEELQSKLKTKFQFLVESLTKEAQKMPFNEGYTDLYITEADTGQVNEEHEVRQLERYSRTSVQERIIQCQDIFKETGDPIRTVLTKGVAGVGKTVLTQKFSLDWAEDRANQYIQLLFPFTFRELNVLRGKEYSLVGLVHHFFKKSQNIFSFQHLQVLFIFDGLDECSLHLDFSRTPVLTEPTKSASVEVLLVNLIRGFLLPSARLWITTRPAAANQIQDQYVSMVTEVRGFTDEQKEQYFMKRFRDELQVAAVMSHIKKIRSLYMMCYLPIFCWILSTVFQNVLEQTENLELPKTLTEMYIHFLVVQAKVKNIKFHGRSGRSHHWTTETKKTMKSLGRLAFEQLQERNMVFYESDLNECELDTAEIDRYCGVFREAYREEQGLYESPVYCFIHLSVQEFLAALHVHQTFVNSGENLLLPSHWPEPSNVTVQSYVSSMLTSLLSVSTPADVFYRSAVDLALQSPNGHLDLFLRFLLGLALPTNQRLLHGLLTERGSDQINQRTVKYIKHKLNKEGLSEERSLNLLHCLNELKDDSLMQEIQQHMADDGLSKLRSPAEWSALSFLLLSSDTDLKEFDLRKYCRTEKALLGLLPVVKASTRAILSNCELPPLCCGPLASTLSSSSLTFLDLSNNDLQDLGVELLCEGLKDAPCRLKILRLSGCLVSHVGGTYLASSLRSAPFNLRELDLSYNHPGDSIKLLTALQAPHGPLLTLSLDPNGEEWMTPGPKKYYHELTLDPNTAHKSIELYADKRSMKVGSSHHVTFHEDRFTDYYQILCSPGLWGRFYWEVTWFSVEEADIAVSYSRIRRSGPESRFGENDVSWSMRVRRSEYRFTHNKIRKTVPSTLPVLSTFSFRVGVFLDSEAGELSFYEISADGQWSRLHTFNCAFTEPLFPGFGIGGGRIFYFNWVSLLKVDRRRRRRPLEN